MNTARALGGPYHNKMLSHGDTVYSYYKRPETLAAYGPRSVISSAAAEVEIKEYLWHRFGYCDPKTLRTSYFGYWIHEDSQYLEDYILSGYRPSMFEDLRKGDLRREESIWCFRFYGEDTE